MKGNRKKPEPPQFLSGWKEIANYLGKGVRTVQRYEWQMGLPVRRPAGKPRGSVVATKPELDAWVGASPIREAFHLTRLAPDSEASRNAIKNGIEEMCRLRDEMLPLRAELHSSLLMLRESILSLQGELNRNQWREMTPAFTILKRDSQPKRTIDSLASHDGQRRVS
ncbi:MAG: hypothetical protein WA609_08005 [Terriglobales bacterium]